MRHLITLAAAASVAVLAATAALAATGTPFGGATTQNGTLTLVSNTGDAGSTNDSSGASFTGTGVTTFASIATLSAEFNVTDDDCSNGSPRFQIQVQTPSGAKNVFAFLGPAPSFTGCSPNVWIASGNLVLSDDGRFDTGQAGGSAVATYAQALALVGGFQVTGISLVVDSGGAFADKEQTVMVRNVKVNDSTFFAPGETNPGPGEGGGKSPAQACRQLRAEMGADAFRMAYGTNHNGRNAFGKCVSKMARLKNDEAREAAVARIDDAANRCSERVATGHHKGKGHQKEKHHGKKGHRRHGEEHLTLRDCLRHAV